MVFQRKKNGKLRFCVDLRKTNYLVKQDEFKPPKIADIIANLENMKFFSVIDLKDGFFQVELYKGTGTKQHF